MIIDIKIHQVILLPQKVIILYLGSGLKEMSLFSSGKALKFLKSLLMPRNIFKNRGILFLKPNSSKINSLFYFIK